jgi:hypothetical protein
MQCHCLIVFILHQSTTHLLPHVVGSDENAHENADESAHENADEGSDKNADEGTHEDTDEGSY